MKKLVFVLFIAGCTTQAPQGEPILTIVSQDNASTPNALVVKTCHGEALSLATIDRQKQCFNVFTK